MRLLEFVVAPFNTDDNFNRWETHLLGCGRVALRKRCSHHEAWKAAFGVPNQGV